MSNSFSDVVLFKVAFSIPSDSEFGAAIVEVFRGQSLSLGNVRVASVKSIDIADIKTVWGQDPWVNFIRFVSTSFKRGKIDFRTTKEFTEILHKTFAPYVHSYIDVSSRPFEEGIHSAAQNNSLELLTMHHKSSYSSITERVSSSLSKGRTPDKIPLVICSSEIIDSSEYQQILEKELSDNFDNPNDPYNLSSRESGFDGLPHDSVLVECRPVVSAASGVLVYGLRAGMDIIVGIPWDSRSESLIRYLSQESEIPVDPAVPFIQPARVISTKPTSRGVVICVHLKDNFYGTLDEVEPIKVKIAPPGAYRGEKTAFSPVEKNSKKDYQDHSENHSSSHYQNEISKFSPLYYWTTIGFVSSITLGFLLTYFFFW